MPVTFVHLHQLVNLVAINEINDLSKDIFADIHNLAVLLQNYSIKFKQRTFVNNQLSNIYPTIKRNIALLVIVNVG